MLSLRFRLPGRSAPLGHWLASLLPGIDREARRDWIEQRLIRVDGRVADRTGFECPAGARVEIANFPQEHRPLLASLPRLPPGTHTRWRGLIDDPPWPGGALRAGGSWEMTFEIGERREGLAAIVLEGPETEAARICEWLAEAGMPLVGDLERDGLGAAGGVRLDVEAAGADEPVEVNWPEERAWLRGENSEQGAIVPPRLRVSDETARAIRKGHPWILPDEASDPVTRFSPGTCLHVVSRDGQRLAWAHAEGDPKLAARVWAKGAADLRQAASIEARVARALSRRRELFEPKADKPTNAFRLIHGEGDDLPGLVVDRLGPLLRVLVTGRSSDSIRERVIDALRAQLPVTPEGEPWSVLELLHLRSANSCQPDRVRWIVGGLDQLAEQNVGLEGGRFRVSERGLSFEVDPGWEESRRVRPGVGLFVDQRENRARLDKFAARGGAWLNLFAHTGAFSTSLLAAGASRVTSVDLSGAYLDRLESNLILNRDRGVDLTRHRSVRGDGRRFVETLDAAERFAGIVLDPPTAAAAGRRFWSLQRDLEPILRLCVERLDSAGCLLVTQNRSGPPLGLDRVLERAASRLHRPIARIEPAPAGADHPARPEFPEGDPFEGWMLVLE